MCVCVCVCVCGKIATDESVFSSCLDGIGGSATVKHTSCNEAVNVQWLIATVWQSSNDKYFPSFLLYHSFDIFLLQLGDGETY